MRALTRGLIAFVILAAAVGLCRADQVPAQQVVTLDIQGMKAGSAAQVEKALTALPGVSMVKVDEKVGVAVVGFDPVKTKQDELTRAVQQAGYLAQFADARFECPHCGAKYSKDGQCIICEVPLKPSVSG